MLTFFLLIAPISCLKVLPPTGFHKTTKSIPTCTQTSLILPRYHNIVQASSNTTDTTIPPLSLTFVGVIESNPSLKHDSFSYPADLEAVERGLEVFRGGSSIINQNINAVNKGSHHFQSTSGSDVDKTKTLELEAELKQMHENYQRLSALHKQTWEEHARWRLEVEADKKSAT